ncbi:xylulokinase [Rhizobium alvei]|uniref:Xylulose kinase n=1 Tax=Rhizobium alvei TaxID=1132659 RepID=A0ABT8YT01_9HYPH|nr:xylulokinase [Rhizobium alvei]MDO6966898.1 xylulokinase [Rhizobium alvei]
MYLGIDLGTSGVKAILIDEEQQLVGEESSRPLDVSRPHRGWSEQDPELWWQAVTEAVDRLALAFPVQMAAVRGIGLSGQMYGATCLDESDRPLRPAILWNDTRTERQCAALKQVMPDIGRIAGRNPSLGVTAPKLMWLRDHEPDLFSRIRTVLLPKDYVRLKLSGDKVSDLADSSGTMWVDVGARDWSEPLLAASSMDVGQMPRLCEGTEATGRLRAELCRRWGMAVAPVIAGGGGDNACGACGTGVIKDGMGTVSLGTSGVLFVANGVARPSMVHSIETLCHSVPGVWHQMSVILSATSCLNWLAGLLKRPASELVAELGTDLGAPAPVVFVPFLDGCWSPHADASIRGAFVGLNHSSDDAVLTRAVLQGVAFAMRECADAFRSTGTRIDNLLAIGGGSRSELWLKIMATILGVELQVPASSQLGAAFGAARLAIIAAENAAPESILVPPPIRNSISPDSAREESYQENYQTWLSVIPDVRKASAALARAS